MGAYQVPNWALIATIIICFILLYRVGFFFNMSHTDPLTGLGNRNAMWRDRRRNKKKGRFVLMLDVDYFGPFNKKYGESCGDAILAKLAGILNETVRETDVIYRIGGEEFIIIANINERRIEWFCQKINEAVRSAEILHDGTIHKVTISIGAAPIERDLPRDASDIISPAQELADEAMQQAKTSGRDTYRIVPRKNAT